MSNGRRMPFNTIQIDIKDEVNANKVNRKEVIIALYKQLMVDPNNIEYISTPFSFKSWIITLKTSCSIQDLIDKEIKLANEKCTISEYGKKKRLNFKTFKIMWLLHNTDLGKLKGFIEDKLDCEGDIKFEKLYEEVYNDLDVGFEGANIKTGNVIATVSFNQEHSVKSISGNHEFNEKKIRIVTFGDPKKCFSCGEEGHLKQECQKAKTNEKISYASITNTSNQINKEQNQRNEDEDFTYEVNTNNNISSSQINSINDVQNVLNKEHNGNIMNNNPLVLSRKL